MKFYENFKQNLSPEKKRQVFTGLQELYGIKKDAVRNLLKFLDKDIQKFQIIAKQYNPTGSIDELVKEINQPTPTPKSIKL